MGVGHGLWGCWHVLFADFYVHVIIDLENLIDATQLLCAWKSLFNNFFLKLIVGHVIFDWLRLALAQ